MISFSQSIKTNAFISTTQMSVPNNAIDTTHVHYDPHISFKALLIYIKTYTSVSKNNLKAFFLLSQFIVFLYIFPTALYRLQCSFYKKYT